MIKTTKEFGEYLAKFFGRNNDKLPLYFNYGVTEIVKRENVLRDALKKQDSLKIRYFATFYGGAFGEGSVNFVWDQYGYRDEKELTMQILGTLKDTAYYIDWKNKKIKKGLEVLG